MSLYQNLKEEEAKNRKELKENSTKANKNSIKEIKGKAYKDEEKIIIGKYSDAPEYLKDNEYIKNGYLIYV